MLVQRCHVPVGYALHLRMLRIETRRHGVGADTMCAAVVDAHSTADDGFSQGYHDKTSLRYLAQQRHRNGPPAAVRGRLPGVPAAMLVDETPTLAHSVAAPIVVTVSASLPVDRKANWFGRRAPDCYSRRRLVLLSAATSC